MTTTDIPTLTEAPGGSTLSFGTRLSRRSFMLRSAAATAGVAVLNTIVTSPLARATVGTEYTSTSSCGNYSYNDSTYACFGSSYISSNYCGGDKWFLHGSGTCWVSYPTKACGGGGWAKRNAWRWKKGSTTYRCADGYQQNCGQSSPVFKICQAAL